MKAEATRAVVFFHHYQNASPSSPETCRRCRRLNHNTRADPRADAAWSGEASRTGACLPPPKAPAAPRGPAAPPTWPRSGAEPGPGPEEAARCAPGAGFPVFRVNSSSRREHRRRNHSCAPAQPGEQCGPPCCAISIQFSAHFGGNAVHFASHNSLRRRTKPNPGKTSVPIWPAAVPESATASAETPALPLLARAPGMWHHSINLKQRKRSWRRRGKKAQP